MLRPALPSPAEHASEQAVGRAAGLAILFAFFVGFMQWGSMPIFEAQGPSVCWAWAAGCTQWFSLSALPASYAQNYFFAGLLALLTASAWGLVYGYDRLAWGCFFLVWAFKAFVIRVLQVEHGTFEYYDVLLGFVWLFAPRKVAALRLTYVLLYVLAATIKIHPGWVQATYFTSLQLGLPVFPDAWAPLASNVVILMQLVGAWFLLARNRLLQGLALLGFIGFHLYSELLVGYRYIASTVPIMLVLFWDMQRAPVSLSGEGRRRPIATAVFAALLLVMFTGQLWRLAIPGDDKLTFEGTRLGLHMFEANHQCRTVVRQAGQVLMDQADVRANHRCDPYPVMARLQALYCAQGQPTAWTFDHSINGGPFKRIVDVPDVCALHYSTFSKNDWIRTEDTAVDVGLSAKNMYVVGVGGVGKVRLENRNGVLRHDSLGETNHPPAPTSTTRAVMAAYWVVWSAAAVLFWVALTLTLLWPQQRIGAALRRHFWL